MSAPVAVVTGASRGIGKQLCIDLAGSGYDVVCAARSTSAQPSKLPGSIEETAKLVEERGQRAMVAPLDVRDEEAVNALCQRVYTEWGRSDLLINNAAVAPQRPALKDTTKRWRLGVDVNLNGPFYMMHAFCPRMAETGEGRVINISSGAAVSPAFGRPSYTATKLALEGLSQALSFELKDKVAVTVLRLELSVWSEGYTETLSDVSIPFEHPIIMSDAVLWIAKQPIEFTGQILTIGDLRDKGVVRGVTLYKDFEAS